MTKADRHTRDGRNTGEILDSLFDVIDSRRQGDPKESYTAKLFSKGPSKIAEKVGEEAVEAVIEIVRQRPEALAEESADLLFHLMVAWAETGVDPRDVWDALASRMGTSGIEEKKRRKETSGET